MKTISLDEEAYRILKGLKTTPQDSFSDVVKRRFGHRPRLEDSLGGWSDLTDEEAEALREETVREFGTTTGDAEW